MRYFVTGATGFLGGRLARQLREAGHDVVALVRTPAKAGDLAALGVHLAPGDVTDPASLRAPMEGADGVFHCAAWYKVGADAGQAEAINVGGTRHVLECMRDLAVPKGVYTSTLAVFSDTRGVARDEAYRYDGPHLSHYDETKWRAHYEVALPMMEAGLPLVVLQPGAIYGPGDTSQMGDLFRQWLDGKPLGLPLQSAFCWAHVDDVARAHVLAMERGQPGETYIVSGPCHTLHEAFNIAGRVTGRRPPRLWVPPAALKAMAPLMGLVERVAPVPEAYTAEALRVMAGATYLGDNRKAHERLGYSPRPLEEGFRDTFAAGP